VKVGKTNMDFLQETLESLMRNLCQRRLVESSDRVLLLLELESSSDARYTID
jgi:hypothetical protein